MRNFKTFSLSTASAAIAALIALGSVASTAGAAQATVAATASGTAAAAAAIPGSGLVNGPDKTEAQKLNGSGATFPQILYTNWIATYNKVTGVQINYGGGGSGKGIGDINDKKVDFGASDAFIGAKDPGYDKVQSGEEILIPMTEGAVVLIYNLPNFKDTLKLTPDTLSAIYLGTIKKWNDAALVKDNPGLANVDSGIIPVHRTDSSGTTNIFTSYLSAISATWKSGPGAGKDLGTKWPVAGLSDAGNNGVAANVSSKTGTIGYVELSYAAAATPKLTYADLKNSAGNFVTATGASITAAADLKVIPDSLNISILNAAGDKAYPISAPTWQIVYKTQTDPAIALALTRFLWWELHDGQQYASALGFAPLPAAVVKIAEQKVLSIQINGKQALPTAYATPNPSVVGATSTPTVAAPAATVAATMAATTAK
jgi:phosphate transport system substrate-binding protein